MSNLDELGVKIVDQGELETTIAKRANEAIISKDKEVEEKRLQKTQTELDKVANKIRILQKRLDNPRTKISQRKQIRDEIAWFQDNELKPLQEDLRDIQSRLKDNEEQLNEVDTSKLNVNDRLPGETEKEFLIRIGKITAFGNENAFEEDQAFKSHQHLRAPGFGESAAPEPEQTENINDDDYTYEEPVVVVSDDQDEYKPEEGEEEVKDEDEDIIVGDEVQELTSQYREERNIDDGDEEVYQARLKNWVKSRSSLRKDDNSSEEEWFKPSPSVPDSKLNDQFKLPGDIYPALFDYQKTCVQWLWELYSQKTGGIIGDEMGLGKTIQVISFIAGLHYSKLLDKPVLIVVPATVLNQWVNEFHRWWPPLRCVILHSIGSGMGKKIDESKLEQYLEQADPDSIKKSNFRNASNAFNAAEIVDTVMEKGHVLITTYVGLRIYSKVLLKRSWGYCILDEGHKIRNPNSDISLLCKQIRTYNRIILSGTPIQNNLIELWSLFDFIFPGRLGTLPVFEQQFALPIKMGGYANATNVQVQTGYKCAVILRDLISPYLLRRLKHDVAKDLPKKEEMVLFIKLTQYQQDMYEQFLNSEDISAILKGRRNVLMGVDILRKICNHPDLVLQNKALHDYGNSARSGKMQVVKKLVQLWVSQQHKILIFCQTKQMLDILERFVTRLAKIDIEGKEIAESSYNYLRMDGSTPISKRQYLVDSFNNTPSINMFLLTTKVGGLGINLTGADRIIIFDPDWNPSTDIQARERAWRLGQTKDIVIYRLMTMGTIEEKIYHRQIFKTFLTNKILKDPKQRRFFKMNDLHDLFTLGDQNDVGTETSEMFHSNEKVINDNNAVSKHNNGDDFYKVANIMGVTKLDKFAGDNDEPQQEEDRIMEGLFKNTGVHSAVAHDEIINSDKQETIIIERESNKIVSEAVNALKESRQMTRRKAAGTPTWTGKFGSAGKFGANASKRKNNELSSSTILQKLKKRKEGTEKSNYEKLLESKQGIIKELIEIIKTKPDHFAKSNDIIDQIKVEVNFKNEKEMILIRSILKEICNWDVINKGWQLKQEFAG